MSEAPVLYFIRHGETDWNREGRLQGQQDIALNETGERQARAAARALQALEPHRVRDLPVYASPLARARETARLMRLELGLSEDRMLIEQSLIELSFGIWEGRLWREIRRSEPAAAEARLRDKWGYAPPGGESYAALALRVQRFLETLKMDSCIVAHGGIARALLVLRGGVAPAEAAERPIWQGRVLRFRKGAAEWLPMAGHAG